MTLKEYKQELYEAHTAHLDAASLALDKYVSAKTERDERIAMAKNKAHLAASSALRWALDKASLVDENDTLVFIDEPFYSAERECWCVYQKSGDIVQTLFMTEEQAKTYKERKELYYGKRRD